MFLKFNYHDLSELRIVKVISVYMKLGRLIKYVYFWEIMNYKWQWLNLQIPVTGFLVLTSYRIANIS